MNSRAFTRSAFALAFAFALLLVSGARSDMSACTYYLLADQTPYSYNTSPTLCQTSPSSGSWALWAVRPAAGEDWDIGVYSSMEAEPVCVSGQTANSTYSTSIVDFVLSDFSTLSPPSFYPRLVRYTGTNPATTTWCNGEWMMHRLETNGPNVDVVWSGNMVAELWTATLQAGATYTVHFAHDAGINASLLLFRNTGTGAYWTNRSAAIATFTSSGTFTAPAAGTYAFVVVNDNAGSGHVSLGIGRCDASLIDSGVTTAGHAGYSYWQMSPTAGYWNVMLQRPTSGGTYALDMFATGGGPGYVNCNTDLLAGEATQGAPALVAVDFNLSPLWTRWASTSYVSGTWGVNVQWRSGSQTLVVDGAPIERELSMSDLGCVYDLPLVAGRTYNFQLESSYGSIRMLLFRNTTGGAYAAPGAQAVLSSYGCTSYTAPATGDYGLVLVKSGGLSNSVARVSVVTAPCVCPTPLTAQATVSVPAPDGYFSAVSPAAGAWCAVATRGTALSDDWDLTTAGAPSGQASPACLGPTQVQSSLGSGQVDLALFDFKSMPADTLYARSHRFAGTSPTGLIEWRPALNVDYYSNSAPVVRAMAASELAHVYNAGFTGGITYTIDFIPGADGQKLLIFENAAGGTYRVPRSSAVLTATGMTTFTPATSGVHAIVIVNDFGTSGTYSFRYGYCTSSGTLASGVPVTTLISDYTYQFTPRTTAWSAVGVRSTEVDWDLSLSTTLGSAYPACLDPVLASSSNGSMPFVDVVVGDQHHAPARTRYYARALQFTPNTYWSARTEWDGGRGSLIPNDNNPVTQTTDADDVLAVWDMAMTAGVTYHFALGHNASANLHMLVFRNPASSAYYAGRSSAVLDVPFTSTSATYTAPATDDYAVVVVNDDGGSDTYWLSATACPAPALLTSGASFDLPPVGFIGFNQSSQYWTAVGVRGTTDWDIATFASATGGGPGICLSNELGSSTYASGADFVVGDFNGGANVPGWYYARPYRYAGAGSGRFEWDTGSDVLYPNQVVERTTDASDVLEIWDVGMQAGGAYQIYFAHTGAADLKLLLFRNPGATYWVSRGARVLETAVTTTYTAPATDYYGLVVVNDNGQPGTYTLSLSLGGVAVDGPALPAITALSRILPNPARGVLNVEYALHRSGAVQLELLDTQGRRVATLEDGVRDAGMFRSTWSGGRATPPGLYLVRLTVNGKRVGEKKVALLQ